MSKKTPILGKDIQKGDLIRFEFNEISTGRENGIQNLEYIAREDRHEWRSATGEHFLLNRNVKLPTVNGHYLSGTATSDKEEFVYTLSGTQWFKNGFGVKDSSMYPLMPLLQLRLESEVVKEVLAKVAYANRIFRGSSDSTSGYMQQVANHVRKSYRL